MLVGAPGSGILLNQPEGSEGEQHTTYRDRLLAGEKLIAETNATKKDTNLLGAKLQEMYMRNEQLSTKLNERNSHLLEAKKVSEQSDKVIDDLVRERDSLKVRCEQERRQSIALSHVLSQR